MKYIKYIETKLGKIGIVEENSKIIKIIIIIKIRMKMGKNTKNKDKGSNSANSDYQEKRY